MKAGTTQESMWQRATSHPVSLLGFVVMMSGTVVGNIAISKMTSFVNDNDTPPKPEMFSTEKEIETTSVGSRRAVVIAKYQELQPDGRLYGMLKFGWVLNGVGFVIVILGVFL